MKRHQDPSDECTHPRRPDACPVVSRGGDCLFRRNLLIRSFSEEVGEQPHCAIFVQLLVALFPEGNDYLFRRNVLI